MYAGKRIRVLIIDDSLMFRTAIAKSLEQDPQLEVAGTASGAFDAKDKISSLAPDVITLDVEMPGMSGIDFLKTVMPKHPIPVIAVSGADSMVFEAMRAGAVDFIAKPEDSEMAVFSRELASKIKIASVARLVGPILRDPASAKRGPVPCSPLEALTGDCGKNMLVAIGASTGGTEATSRILKALPAGMPGIVIVQHMPPVFTQMYAERLDRETLLTVHEAQDGMPILAGHAYVAPGDAHLRVARRGAELIAKVGGTEKVSGHCPSVNVLFESVAEVMGNRSVGILLTGMGADGATGLLRMKEKGAYTIGQDKQSSVVYGMPMEAMKLGAVLREAPLEAIPGALLEQLKRPIRP